LSGPSGHWVEFSSFRFHFGTDRHLNIFFLLTIDLERKFTLIAGLRADTLSMREEKIENKNKKRDEKSRRIIFDTATLLLAKIETIDCVSWFIWWSLSWLLRIELNVHNYLSRWFKAYSFCLSSLNKTWWHVSLFVDVIRKNIEFSILYAYAESLRIRFFSFEFVWSARFRLCSISHELSIYFCRWVFSVTKWWRWFVNSSCMIFICSFMSYVNTV
jgi:hypothetical protein